MQPTVPSLPGRAHATTELCTPAAWRRCASPQDAAGAFTAQHWVRRARAAERAGASLVIVDDSRRPAGRAARAARRQPRRRRRRRPARPADQRIGLAPVVPVTYREPFHVGKEIQTLDHVSLGRGAVQVDVAAPRSTRGRAPRRCGTTSACRATCPPCGARPTTRSRCSSGCGTAGRTTRSSSTPGGDRYIDRDKVHAIEFTGEFFSRARAPRSRRARRRAARSSSSAATSRTRCAVAAAPRGRDPGPTTPSAAARGRAAAVPDASHRAARRRRPARRVRREPAPTPGAALDALEPWPGTGVVVGGPATVARAR